MKVRANQIMKCAVVLALLFCLATPMVFAQADPGDIAIFQNGIKVGEIYVPARASNGLYAEHWILYPNYVYPNAKNGVKTEMVPLMPEDADNPNYKSEEDFFARARFGAGYRYIHVTANDSTRLPRP